MGYNIVFTKTGLKFSEVNEAVPTGYMQGALSKKKGRSEAVPPISLFCLVSVTDSGAVISRLQGIEIPLPLSYAGLKISVQI